MRTPLSQKLKSLFLISLCSCFSGCVPCEVMHRAFSGEIKTGGLNLKLDDYEPRSSSFNADFVSFKIDETPPWDEKGRSVVICIFFKKPPIEKAETYIKVLDSKKSNLLEFRHKTQEDFLSHGFTPYAGRVEMAYKNDGDFKFTFKAPELQTDPVVIQGCYETRNKREWRQIIPYAPK